MSVDFERRHECSVWGEWKIADTIGRHFLLRRKQVMEITKNTRVADILKEYGDIADVMEVFGIKRVGRYSIRALAAKAVTVEWAARIHRVPLNEFLEILHKAVLSTKEKSQPATPIQKGWHHMVTNKMNGSSWGTRVVILSLLLIFFALPHTLEDFATGEPAKAGAPVLILAYVIARIFALQGLGLFWIGRHMRRGHRIHVLLGLFWPLAAGSAQLPKILSQGMAYRAGFISIFYVGGMIVIGIVLFIVSILALKAGRSE
jgi:hypothetical protein